MAKEAKEGKAKRAPKPKKDSYLKDNYVQINDENGIRTDAMHVRGVGCLVRETTESGQVTSTFVPGVKVKTKKDWKYLIIDKGPKKRKGGEEDDNTEEEDD